MQHCWPTTPNIVGCYMLCPFALPVAFCWMLLRVATQSLKPVKLFSQQLPTFLLFCDRWSVAQQCWIRLHSSSNIVGATHAHYAWFTKTYGLYPSHDALQVGTLWERRVVQWWEHSLPTNVARVWILASMPYVGWVCCWFCPLLREVFLQVLRFSPLLKNQHFQIPIRSGTHGHVSTSSYELLSSPWVNCCVRLHTTTNTHATTPNIDGATMMGVVASVCTQP